MHSIVARQDSSSRMIVCSFFYPRDSGRLELASIDEAAAVSAAEHVLGYHREDQDRFLHRSVAVTGSEIETALRFLDARGVPVAGRAVRGNADVLGSMDGKAYATPLTLVVGDDASPSTLVHELAHLAGFCHNYELLIVLCPCGCDKVRLCRCPCGCGKVAVYFTNTTGLSGYGTVTWTFAQSERDELYNLKAEWRGNVWEEAAAEILELQYLKSTSWRPAGPTTHSTGDSAVTIPGEFAGKVAAWTVMALETACPGLIELLIRSRKATVDRAQIRSTLERSYPGLFNQLDRASLAEAAVAVSSLLKR